jgi:hypothetical protein
MAGIGAFRSFADMPADVVFASDSGHSPDAAGDYQFARAIDIGIALFGGRVVN